MDRETDMRKTLNELFAVQKLAVLSTHREGHPYASLVAFAAVPDLREILFATARTTRKFANLTADARAAMLIDSRTNRDADFHHAVAVTATGIVDEIEKARGENQLAFYLAKHPHLEQFVKSPTCALLRLQVESYYMVSRFQNVMELHIRRGTAK